MMKKAWRVLLMHLSIGRPNFPQTHSSLNYVVIRPTQLYMVRNKKLEYDSFPSIDNLKLTLLEGLPKLPISRHHVVACHGSPVTGGDLKRKALAIKIGVTLPVLTPVSGHGLPPCLRTLD